MTTTVKINVDMASLEILFKTIPRINEELNEISFVHGTTKRQLQIILYRETQNVLRYSAESLFSSQCRAVVDQLLYKYYNIIAANSSEQARKSNQRLPPRRWNHLE